MANIYILQLQRLEVQDQAGREAGFWRRPSLARVTERTRKVSCDLKKSTYPIPGGSVSRPNHPPPQHPTSYHHLGGRTSMQSQTLSLYKHCCPEELSVLYHFACWPLRDKDGITMVTLLIVRTTESIKQDVSFLQFFHCTL